MPFFLPGTRKFIRHLLFLSLFAVPAGAEILTFNGVANYATLTTYGSNMTGLCTGSGQAGCVSLGNGLAPDIAVSFTTIGAGAYMYEWPAGYGDLPAVGYAAVSGDMADVTLTPQNGTSVTLNSFDLGGYDQTDIASQPVEVVDSSGNVLFSYLGTIKGTGPADSAFSPGITSSLPISIEFSSTYNVGIDNINFDEVSATPEPSTWLLLAIGLGPVLLGSRYRNRRWLR